MTELTQPIPLFPLDLVLFPGMVLPLHIFELRYRRMVRDCIANDEPFGLVWAEEEPLILPADRPLVGTIALMTEVESLSDGRYNISTVGGERFQIRSISYDQPYLVGHVEPFPPLEVDSPEVEGLRPVLLRLLQRYVTLLNEVADEEVALAEIPEDAAMLGWATALYYQCQNWRKQELLSLASVPALMHRLIDLLRVENPLVEQVIEYQQRGRIPPLIASTLAVYGLN